MLLRKVLSVYNKGTFVDKKSYVKPSEVTFRCICKPVRYTKNLDELKKLLFAQFINLVIIWSMSIAVHLQENSKKKTLLIK